MAKERSQYVCTDCGAKSAQWVGKCPTCKSWNSLEEQKTASNTKRQHRYTEPTVSKARPLATVNVENVKRLNTSERELDRVLGGGIVPGALMLIGGEPGIGKSTLMLQVAMMLSAKGNKIPLEA